MTKYIQSSILPTLENENLWNPTCLELSNNTKSTLEFSLKFYFWICWISFDKIVQCSLVYAHMCFENNPKVWGVKLEVQCNDAWDFTLN